MFTSLFGRGGLRVIGLVDCNNFFVSCECVFNPRLRGKRVAVLSNNDGCVVARSNEFKQLDIPMGTPYFKLKPMEELLELTFVSSNYELYADMSSRVMSVLRDSCPEVEQYSIDEAFIIVDLPADSSYLDWGIKLRGKIQQWIGIPTGIGFAASRTLAKLAAKFAKKRTSEGVFVMPDDPVELLSSTPVGDIWGVGGRLGKRLHDLGIRTAEQLRQADLQWLGRRFNVCLVRTALELRGQDVVPPDKLDHPIKSATCSRTFGTPIVDFDELRSSVAEFAEIACERMRRADRQAVGATVFFNYSAEYKPKELPAGTTSMTILFDTPTNNTSEVFEAISPYMKRMFIAGRRYRKSGIVFFGLECGAQCQPSLFPKAPPAIPDKAYQAIDSLNAQYGHNAVHALAAGIKQPWKIRRDKLSRQYTTNWNDILQAH